MPADWDGLEELIELLVTTGRVGCETLDAVELGTTGEEARLVDAG